MRNKKIFYFDEEKVAKDIIDNGFKTKGIDYNAMYIVAKYFREKEQLGKIRLRKKIIDFCKKHEKHFNPIVENDQITRWVSSALKYNLRKIKTLDITKDEISFLKKIQSNKDRKLLYMTLLFAKALKKGNTHRGKTKYKKSDKYYIRYSNFGDIIRLSELTNISELTFAKILHKYKEHFLFYNPEKELIRLEYAQPKGEKITITNLDNLIESYVSIFGKRMTYCERCNEPIEKRTNNQKYCENCALEVRKEKQRDLMRERRS